MLDLLRIAPGAGDPDRAHVVSVLYGAAGAAAVAPAQPATAVAAELVIDIVQRWCAEAPIVLVADDLQWADDLSLAVWGRLQKLTGQLPLLLIAVCRPDNQDPTLSLPRQLDNSRRALPDEFVIVAHFYDVESGRTPDELRGQTYAHEQLDIPIPRDGSVADLLAESRRPDRRFVAVICESIERVARTMYGGTKIEHELEQAGVALLAADEGIDRNTIPELAGGSGPVKRATPTLTRRVKQAALARCSASTATYRSRSPETSASCSRRSRTASPPAHDCWVDGLCPLLDQPFQLADAAITQSGSEPAQMDAWPAGTVAGELDQPAGEARRCRRGERARSCVQPLDLVQVITHDAGGVVHVHQRTGDLSTALCRYGTACRAAPAVISWLATWATSRAVCEYSRRPRYGWRRRSQRCRSTSAERSSSIISSPTSTPL
jgi:hypothetical protein